MGDSEQTFPLRVAVRMTGLSAERIRAWEARYGIVEPLRTSGGTRRYRTRDLERLRLLRSLVEAGHRIGDLARLDDADLRARAVGGSDALARSRGADPAVAAPGSDDVEMLFSALERLDLDFVRRDLERRRAALGLVGFARAFVLPFLVEVGRRWEHGTLSVAAEHLVSSLLSGMLISALRETPPSDVGPVIVFATPSGERHELGLLVSALLAAQAGAAPIFVGADVPEHDLELAISRSAASVLALALVTVDSAQAERTIRSLRARLPRRVEIWLGGSGIPRMEPMRGVVRLANVDQLTACVLEKRMAADGRAA